LGLVATQRPPLNRFLLRTYLGRCHTTPAPFLGVRFCFPRDSGEGKAAHDFISRQTPFNAA
jgi:hypothetical protein